MPEKVSTDSGTNYLILVPTMLLLCLGLVMIYSASSNLGQLRLGDGYFYLKKQAIFCMIGVAVMFAARYVPYTLYSKFVYPLLIISICLLGLLFVPALAREIGGAHRWLNLGPLTFQPSELIKFSLAVYMAYSMSKKSAEMASFSKGVLPHLLVAGILMVLVLLQPDLGTTVIMGIWVLIALFVGGVRMFHISTIFLLCSPVVIWLITRADYRIKRWLAFMDPWEDPTGIGFQIIHSFLAFGSGGIFGAGLGNSKQKLFYLPESHTDFVLSITGEELGLLGVTSIIILFGTLIMGGIRVALKARDLYSTYLALGLTSFLGLQVIINMAVVLGLLPTKGLTLPLISYGGSSLIMTLLSIGVLLNISARS